MTIRRAVRADALAIATVHVRSWQAAYPGLVPQDYLDALTPEGRLRDWEEILGASTGPSRSTLVLTAEPDDDIVGFVSFAPTGDDDGDPETVAEVQTLYVAPETWGHGVGDQLLSAALDVLKDEGFAEVTLWALHTNETARRFYERRGWARDGATKVHDWNAFIATDVRYRIALCEP